jgi:hypothetical protein
MALFTLPIARRWVIAFSIAAGLFKLFQGASVISTQTTDGAWATLVRSGYVDVALGGLLLLSSWRLATGERRSSAIVMAAFALLLLYEVTSYWFVLVEFSEWRGWISIARVCMAALYLSGIALTIVLVMLFGANLEQKDAT